MSYHSSSSASFSSSGEYPQNYGPGEYRAPMYHQPQPKRTQVYFKHGGTIWHTGRPEPYASQQHLAHAQGLCRPIPSTQTQNQPLDNHYMGPSPTLRTRYPQPPSYSSPYENSLPTYIRAPTSSFYSGLGNFSPFGASELGSGRSNCHSPTYNVGLTEVLASRAPGSSVLCPKSKRPSCQYLCSLKIKQLILIILGLVVLTGLGVVVLNRCVEYDVRAYEFVTNQYDAEAKRLNSGETPETWPQPPASNDEFKQEPVSPDMKSRSPLAADANAKPGKKSFNVVYSFDDVNDDEAYIEDVVL